MAIKGFSSKYGTSTGKQRYNTVQDIGSGKSAMDVLPKALFPLAAIATVPDSIYSGNNIVNAGKRYLVKTAHSARVGDVIRFISGNNSGIEAPIEEIVDANTVLLGTVLPSDILITDQFFIMRHITLTIDSSGALSTTSGPTQFVKDAVTTVVNEDTTIPANNEPLPNKLFIDYNGAVRPVKYNGTPADTVAVPVALTNLADGTNINITAGDINVQLTHIGANPDSTRIGDGTNELGITANNEALVKVNTLDIVDHLDSALLDVSSTNIPASAGNPVEVVASLASDVKKIKIVEDIGEFIGLYTGPALGETLKAVLPLGGGDVELEIPSGTRVSLRHMKNSAIATNTYMAINFLG